MDSHSVYASNISGLLRRRQHFSSSQATELTGRRIATTYVCMRTVCPQTLSKFIRLVFWISLVKYYQSERKINTSYLLGVVTRLKAR